MADYRRNFVAGGSFFFTVNLAQRNLSLLTDHIKLLRQAFRYTLARHPFVIDASVVLPEHLHTIWTLPQGDTDYATRWRLIKTFFSRGVITGEPISPSRSTKGERGIWQRRYWQHTIKSDLDFVRHADYIHFNPVKHGFVKTVDKWPHSSFHRFVKLGKYPSNWAGGSENEMEFGERY